MRGLIIVLIMSISISLYSQTGPGGVGNTSGTSTLSGWYDANQGVTTTGTDVTQWNDQSGYGNNLTPPNTTNRPTLTTGSVNTYPVLTFDGTDDYLTAPDATSLDMTTWSIFIVGRITNHKNYNAIVVKGRDSKENYEFLTNFPHTGNIHYPVLYTDGTRSIDTEEGSTFSNTAYGVYQLDYDQSNFNIYINGTNTETDAQTKTPKTNADSLYICNEKGTSGRNFSGTIAEIILFSSPVNSAQRIITENYLAAKYGFSLSTNDIYNKDDAGQGDYDHEVAGIGRVDTSNLHNDAQGSGIVRILNPSGLDNDEFLIWGHDNGIQQATETSDIPSSLEARFDRVWRVSEVNTSGTAVDVGSVDVRFDLTGLGSVTASDLRLLIDTDNDGTFADETAISGATSVGSNVYQFAGVSAIANNLRFTLGTIDKAQTPLPIELIYFRVNSINDKSVKLDWQTASEINNDFFTVQRSIDGVNWEDVENIQGAGNSSSLLTYQTIDDSPYKGVNYYRLKQTDFDGKFTFTQVRIVRINEFSSNIEIYPNPITTQVTIIGSKNEIESVRVYNVLGQNITTKTSIIESSDGKIVLDLSKLSNGMYFIKTETTVNTVYKTIGN